MTKSQLTKILAQKTGLSQTKAEKLITSFGDTIEEALKKGDKVVYSNFGTFYTVHYPSKIIFHPKLGAAKKMIMLPTNAVKWMPSGNIKEMVNSGNIVEGATIHGAKKNSLQKNINKNVSDDFEDGEVEIPITKILHDKKESVSDGVNIYEELMNDGSKVESTFGDAIRVHKTPSFLGRLFNKGDRGEYINKKEDKEKENLNDDFRENVSLVGTGIFNNSGDNKIQVNNESIKGSKPKFPSDDGSIFEKFRLIQSAKQTKGTEKIDKKDEYERDITPFSVEKEEVSFVDLSKTIVPKEILQKIPEKLARELKVVPIEERDGKLIIAMADPEDIQTKEIIKKITQKSIVARLASEEDLIKILDQYSGFDTELREAIETVDKESNEKEASEKEELLRISSESAPAARIVSSLLKRAIREKASDIHIEPTGREVEVRFRIDGVLRKKASLPKDIQLAVVSRIKILSKLKIDEQRLPQDGRFNITLENRRIDFRVSTMPIANGEKVVMRVLDKAAGILTVEQLGFRGSALEILNSNIDKSHGMILSTGPTGSGKTTTLYALIDKLFNEGVNIVTLEDPIEYQMPGINQSQVNADIDYTFANGLRSIVRQDPDIIMIGEIRDAETAEMAVHSALTGHIVLSTLHTNDAAGAAPRLIDMGVEPFLLTSSLNAVIGQRLARKICEDCKEELKISDEEKDKIKAELNKITAKEKEKIELDNLKFYHGKGCKSCGDTGYKGRIGLYEILALTETVKELILKKESSSNIQELAIKEGMVTMLQDGIIKALDGITTIEEVWRITKE